MMRLTWGLARLAALFIIGASEVVAQPETVPGDFLIRMERTACYGECPVVRAQGRRADRIRASSAVALVAAGARVSARNRNGVTLSAAALTVSIRAQTDGPREWSADRKLTIQDFKADVPRKSQQSNAPRGALSFLRIEAAVGCRDGHVVGSARAVFLPSQSWWAGAQSYMWERVRDSQSWLSASRRDLEMKTAIEDANRELLHHEQLHFDMAEIAARKVRRRFDEARNTCTTDGEHAALNRLVGEVTRDYRQEQARYDQETKHGTFLFAQGKWESRVKTALSE